MTKKASFTPVTNSQNNAAEINSALNAVNNKFENTLSLDGSTPNQMEADLDLNSNDILNAGVINTSSLKVNGVTLVPAASVPEWRGAWETSTAYALNDIVRESGSTYICVEAHTSGTFSTDLTTVKWELFAQQGAAGAGFGDMLAANNLSDLANVATARANLGLGTSATTAAAAYATAAQGAKADAALPLASVLDEDDFSTDSETLPPSQQSTKAYVAAQIAASGGGWTTRSPVSATSGTSFSETSIPSGVSEIEIRFVDLSCSGNDNLLVQLGTSLGLVTTGYVSRSNLIEIGNISSTTNGHVILAALSSRTLIGVMKLFHYGGNRWFQEHSVLMPEITNSHIRGSGDVTLPGELDRLSLLWSAGGSFDGSGQYFIRYR